MMTTMMTTMMITMRMTMMMITAFLTWMAVLLPMKVADILRPLGGMSQTAVLMLLGILDRKS